MSITIICLNCHTTYAVPDGLAGKTVTCKRCNALVDVPGRGGGDAGLPSRVEAPYERIVGRPAPLLVDILGIHTRWSADFDWRDILQLIWSLRDIVLLVVLLASWSSYAATAQSAQGAAPFFFFMGLLITLWGWMRMNSISRKVAAANGGAQRPSKLPQALSALLLVVTDPRESLPALRTLFLGVLALVASLSLAGESGSLANVLPIHSLPSFSTPGNPRSGETPVETPVTPTPTPTPIAPPPTSQATTQKSIPPDDESTPIPPPP